MSHLFRGFLPCILALACFCGCSRPSIVSPRFIDFQGGRIPLAQDGQFPAGKEGYFCAGHEKNAYILGKPHKNPGGLSLELEFRQDNPGAVEVRPEFSLALSSRSDGKKPFLEQRLKIQASHFYYVLPLPKGAELARMDLALIQSGDGGMAGEGWELVQFREVPEWKGFEMLEDGIRISPGVSVYRKDGLEHVELSSPFLSAAEPPAASGAGAGYEKGILLAYRPQNAGSGSSAGRISLSDGAKEVFHLRARPCELRTFIPAGIASCDPGASLDVAFPRGLDCLALAAGFFASGTSSYAESGLADFGRILRSGPRGTKYDIYNWDLIPSTLIFDFRDYATQDAYLKRLAFFVEKIGFRGRLASDEELASLHGWNAHDYRAEDLAAFFEAAREKGFPLNAEEKELGAILVDRRVVVERSGRLEPGEGAIVSITRESVPYLRTLFLTHESTHAIFFIDADYRDFVRKTWTSMDKDEKWFWRLYFGWKTYNTDDDYLMANEYQAYLLQQTLAQTKDYFTKNAPTQITEKHPELTPQIDAYMAKYADSFEARAAALDAWLGAKYGFRAGRGSTY